MTRNEIDTYLMTRVGLNNLQGARDWLGDLFRLWVKGDRLIGFIKDQRIQRQNAIVIYILQRLYEIYGEKVLLVKSNIPYIEIHHPAIYDLGLLLMKRGWYTVLDKIVELDSCMLVMDSLCGLKSERVIKRCFRILERFGTESEEFKEKLDMLTTVLLFSKTKGKKHWGLGKMVERGWLTPEEIDGKAMGIREALK